MKLLKNIIYNILSLQEKYLRHQLSKTIGAKHTSKRKRRYSNGCLLDLSSLADVEKQKFEEELTVILKRYDFEPEKILEYISAQGTPVYYIDKASSILNPIGENEGFIYPAEGLRALYISLVVSKKAAFKTNEMFILSKGTINKYYFIYHLYNWFAFKHNISGLDRESQELLKKYLFEDADVNKLQLSEIYKLKDAIKQDKSSIEFVIKLCRNYEGTKQALDKMKNSNGANL